MPSRWRLRLGVDIAFDSYPWLAGSTVLTPGAAPGGARRRHCAAVDTILATPLTAHRFTQKSRQKRAGMVWSLQRRAKQIRPLSRQIGQTLRRSAELIARLW